MNEINIKLPYLHKGQLPIIEDINSSNAMFYTIVTPRQFGKTYMCMWLMLYYAVSFRNSQLMFCSPVYSQASKVFKELMKGVKNSGAEELLIKKFNSAENSIIFNNGSELYFKSVQLAENLRTYSINYMFLDEAAMYKKEVFDSVLRPMLTVQGKKCFLFSTPKGKNWFYNMYALGKDENEKRYRSYKGSSDDNPYANREEIEDAKKALPDDLFRQEYLAEFIDGDGSVFKNINACAILNNWQNPNVNETYYAGLDIAMHGDYYVLTILNKKGDIVFCYRDNKKPKSYLLEQTKICLNKYNPRCTYVETNGIGNGFYEDIQKLHKSVKPFNTSNNSKQDIIEDLIFAFQEETIHIPSKKFFPFYFDELEDFGFKYSPRTRNVSYSAITGHDDTVMSLAIANFARKTPISNSIAFIK